MGTYRKGLGPEVIGAARLVPRLADGRPAALDIVARVAHGCTACPLFARATQTVFGEGPEDAPLMLVGEQPGDHEDREGHPFVGPAGAMLERAMNEIGLDRSTVYLTNAVKHFNFVTGDGRRRLHQKPRSRDVQACKGWLDAEIERVRPKVIVALGATAAAALLGPTFRLTRHRGKPQDGPRGSRVIATYHPSALLRAPDQARRDELWRALLDDLHMATALLHSRIPEGPTRSQGRRS